MLWWEEVEVALEGAGVFDSESLLEADDASCSWDVMTEYWMGRGAALPRQNAVALAGGGDAVGPLTKKKTN